MNQVQCSNPFLILIFHNWHQNDVIVLVKLVWLSVEWQSDAIHSVQLWNTVILWIKWSRSDLSLVFTRVWALKHWFSFMESHHPESNWIWQGMNQKLYSNSNHQEILIKKNYVNLIISVWNSTRNITYYCGLKEKSTKPSYEDSRLHVYPIRNITYITITKKN